MYCILSDIYQLTNGIPQTSSLNFIGIGEVSRIISNYNKVCHWIYADDVFIFTKVNITYITEIFIVIPNSFSNWANRLSETLYIHSHWFMLFLSIIEHGLEIYGKSVKSNIELFNDPYDATVHKALYAFSSTTTKSVLRESGPPSLPQRSQFAILRLTFFMAPIVYCFMIPER